MCHACHCYDDQCSSVQHVSELSPGRSGLPYIMPPFEVVEAWKWVNTERKTRKVELREVLSFLADSNGCVVREASLSRGTDGW